MKLACTGVFLYAHGFAHGQTLYDGTLGTLPEAQGWAFGALGPATTIATNGITLFQTSVEESTQAGWSQRLEPDLVGESGFSLLFRAQLDVETHRSEDRAGFCVILLGADKRGIELGFWADTIFAQADAPLFTRAESVTFSTTNHLTDFALTISRTNYILRADGAAILTGPVRDYTAFGGLISPYRISNFLFIGDNTRSAGGTTRIGRIALVRPPELNFGAPGVISWSGVPGESYTVQASRDLIDWTDLGFATSTSNAFSFTNSPVVNPAQFLRVVYP